MEFTGERVVPGETPHEIFIEHIDRYIFAAGFSRSKVLLDVACGTGYGVDHLIRAGAKRAVGVDLSVESVCYAKHKFGENKGGVFVCADGIQLPFVDNIFDLVISFETLEHIFQYRKFISECKRVLKKNGVFICSTPNKRIFSPNIAQPPNTFHIKEFWPNEFYSLIDNYFVDVTLYGQCDVTLIDNSVERDRGIHNFEDNELVSSAYIIAVAKKDTI